MFDNEENKNIENNENLNPVEDANENVSEITKAIDEIVEEAENGAKELTEEVQVAAQEVTGEIKAEADECNEKTEESETVAEANSEVDEEKSVSEEAQAVAEAVKEPDESVTKTETEEPPVAKGIKALLKKPVYIALGVAFVAIIVIIIAAVSLMGGNGTDAKLVKLSSNAVSSAGEFIYNSKAQTRSLSDNLYASAYNIDRSAMVATRRDGTDVELWYVNSKLEPVKINAADAVSRISISDDGKYVVYVINEVSGTTDSADLYIYNVAKDENTVIAKDIVSTSVIPSPDCKSVAYVADYEASDDNDLYVAILGKEPVKIAKNGCYPVGLINGGKKLFYVNKLENKLYYYNGKEAEKVASDVNVNSVYLNRNCDQVVYFKDSKTYCYKVGDKEAKKIYSKSINYFACSYQVWPSDATIRVCADSFADMVFVDYDYNIVKINDKMNDTDKITSSYDDFDISNDGKELVFANDEELYYVDLSKSLEPKMIYETEDIKFVTATGDLSRIFIVNDDDELIYVTKTGKHEVITNDISTDFNPIVCESSGKVYFVEDGDLYQANRNKKSKTKIESDIEAIQASLGGIIYKTEDEKYGMIF